MYEGVQNPEPIFHDTEGDYVNLESPSKLSLNATLFTGLCNRIHRHTIQHQD